MAQENVARNIPASLRSEVSEKLIDMVLNFPNASKMPSELAKTLLHCQQRGELATEGGLRCLLKASMILEPEKTISLMEELGLREIVTVLKEMLPR